MAVTYEWDINSIDVIRQHGEYENVVAKVVWKCTAVDGSNTKEMIGVQELNVNNLGSEFTSYEEITKEQILEWTKVFLNVPAIERSIIPNTFTRSFLADPDEVTPPKSPTTPTPMPAEESNPAPNDET
jgi:hypothetical protein